MGRHLSKCRRWNRRRHSTFTSEKKSGRLFHDLTSMVILRFSSMSSHRRKVQTTIRPTSSLTITSSQFGCMRSEFVGSRVRQVKWLQNEQVEIDRLCSCCIWVCCDTPHFGFRKKAPRLVSSTCSLFCTTSTMCSPRRVKTTALTHNEEYCPVAIYNVSQFMSPTSSTTSTTQRLLQRSSSVNPAT